MKITTLIFDYGDVLELGHLAHLSKKIKKKYGISEQKVDEAYLKTYEPHDLGYITTEEFWNRFSSELNISKKNLNAWWVKGYGLNYPILKKLAKLKGKYKLGLLSDLSNVLREQVKAQPEFKIFDSMHFSSEDHVKKPEMEFYLLLLKDLKSKPEECIYVDDNPKNIEPAKKLGMKTILFKNNEQLNKDLKKLGVDL